MKTYRQALTEALPEPYASLAISRMPPDDVDDKVEGRIIGSAFTWSPTPEGHGFWEAVQFYTEGRGQLPRLPGSTDLESRILILESRIAALESPTAVATPAADETEEYPTTPLPAGYDKWVCRGQGWKSEDKVWWTARNATYGDPFCTCPSRGSTSGFCDLEYWEAVRTRPRYRLLVSGEVIRDGDEAYIFPPGQWVPSLHSGSTFCELELAPIRRPITDYTDA